MAEGSSRGPHRAWTKYLSLLVPLFLVCVSIGATCNPPPQTTCITGACPSDQVAWCLTCTTPIGEGQTCVPVSQDDCAPPCQAGLACVQIQLGGVAPAFICTNGVVQGGECTPVGGDQLSDNCNAGLFCPDQTTLSPLCASTRLDRCMPYVQVGGQCDGDAQQTTTPRSCAVCEPGTTCLPDGIHDYKLCMATCIEPTDCPCPSGTTTSPGEPVLCSATTATSGTRFCGLQTLKGQTCNSYDRCAANDAAGDPLTCAMSGSGVETCCTGLGTGCGSAGDCCSPESARATCLTPANSPVGTCQTCRHANDACNLDADCCAETDLTCKNGVCTAPARCTADCAQRTSRSAARATTSAGRPRA